MSLEEVRMQLIEAESSLQKWGFDAATTPTGQALYDYLLAEEPIEWNRTLNDYHRETSTAQTIFLGAIICLRRYWPLPGCDE